MTQRPIIPRYADSSELATAIGISHWWIVLVLLLLFLALLLVFSEPEKGQLPSEGEEE